VVSGFAQFKEMPYLCIGMRKILTLAVALMAQVAAMAAEADTMTVRIKAMRCDDCAHKVMTALNEDKGVSDVTFNLERRTATIAYDAAQTTPEAIRARLAATGRFKPTNYDPNDVIRRGIGVHLDDMHCQNCANRIMKQLSGATGIDSIAPHVEKNYVFFRYDANRTCKAAIRKALLDMNFTPVNHYTSDKVSYAYYNISERDANDAETLDKVLALDGVEDVNVNAKRKTMAVTFFNDETSDERLLSDILKSGISAELPPLHVCKEKQEQPLK